MKKFFVLVLILVSSVVFSQSSDKASVIVVQPIPEIVIKVPPAKLVTVVFPEGERFLSPKADKSPQVAVISLEMNVLRAIITEDVRISLTTTKGFAYSIVLVPDPSVKETMFRIEQRDTKSSSTSSGGGSVGGVSSSDVVGGSSFFAGDELSSLYMFRYKVLNLLYAMYNQKDFQEFTTLSPRSAELKRFEGSRISVDYIISSFYFSGDVEGRVVLLINKSSSRLVLSEQDFVYIFDDLEALYIMLDAYELQPGQFTRLFVVGKKKR